MAEPSSRLSSAGKAASPASALLGQRLRATGRGRPVFAVRVRLSRLRLANGLAAAAKLARQPLLALRARPELDVIVLDDEDTLILGGEGAMDGVEAALARTRELLPADILPPPATATDGDGLATWFDLADDDDHATLLALAASPPATPARPALRSPSPSDVARLCATLREEPLVDLIRQQVVLWVKGTRLWTTIFRETYVSIPELRRRYLPDVDLLAHASLFRFVTETLDRRVLAALTLNDFMAGPEPISLNLNLASFATPEFARFQEVRDGLPRPIIELQLADILGDPDGFVATRERLQGQGHSVLIDGVSPRDLDVIDLASLGVDFVKVIWSDAADAGMSAERTQRLRRAIDALGRERVILARIETEEALQWALAAGVACLQGRYIDALVTAMARKGLMPGSAAS